MTIRSVSAIRSLLLISLIASLVGCEVGPDYEAPKPLLPETWQSSQDSHDSLKAELDQKWWDNFNDPILTQLILQAAAHNLDLKIAETRIAEARAGVAQATATLLPTGDVKGAVTREANQLSVPDESQTVFGPLLHKPFNLYQTGFDASWELDLFGGNRRGEESAEATLEASEASRDDVEVSLLAEVARTYVDLRLAQAQQVIAEEVIAADKKTLSIANERARLGQSPGLDVTEAEAELAQAEAEVPVFENNLKAAEYSLDVLLGEQPGAAHRLVAETRPIPVSSEKLVLTAPAVVIAQRPDLRTAERKLAAATAQQGVAMAKFFPDISLNGFFGVLNSSTNNLISGANQSWMAAGSVVWPIFNYGTLSANMDKADAEQQEALATYQKTVISALSDVERSLSAYNEQEKVLNSTINKEDKNQQAESIAKERHEKGLTSLSDVLDAERTLYATQIDLTRAKADATEDLIALYKSLGGGWVKG